MKKIILLILACVSVSSFALKEHYGISRSIRALGMGGAFYTLSNDEYSLFYNPAGLDLYRGENEFMLRINSQAAFKTISGMSKLTTVGDKGTAEVVNSLSEYYGSPLYAGVGLLPFYYGKGWAVGLLLADTKVDVALLGRGIDTTVDLTAISDSGLVIGYSRSVGVPELHVGVNLKGIYRAGGHKVYDAVDVALNSNVDLDPKTVGGAGMGIDADLGAIYELPDFLPFGIAHRASLTFNNLLASTFSMSRVGGTPPGLPRTMTLGWYSAFEGWNFIDNFHFCLDFAEIAVGGQTDPDLGARTGGLFKKLNLGVEMPIGRLSIRAGIHQGYFTAGIGLNLKALRLDLATYGEELGEGPGRLESRRVGLTLAIGGGSNPPDPMTATSVDTVNTKSITPEAKPISDPKKVDPALEISEPAKNEERKPKSEEESGVNAPETESKDAGTVE